VLLGDVARGSAVALCTTIIQLQAPHHVTLRLNEQRRFLMPRLSSFISDSRLHKTAAPAALNMPCRSGPLR
jgi:hypothetical protein